VSTKTSPARRAKARAGDGELELPFAAATKQPSSSAARQPAAPATAWPDGLADFKEFGAATRCLETSCLTPDGAPIAIPTYVNEFWTARQRQANSLHEISYRACFKPQLPRFFIERLTQLGDTVYDPFMGRGTTVLESALLDRIPAGGDINPLSRLLAGPRLEPPTLVEVAERLASIDLSAGETPEDLLVFYHPDTLREIVGLKNYLTARVRSGLADGIDRWIEMVALNRLTGHSSGFFSVYTMPPNQAVSLKSQRKINERRKQTPPRRDIRGIMNKKTRILLSECDEAIRDRLARIAPRARLLTGPAEATPQIPSGSVTLVVTSPPFLNVVDYATDNWLRGWFAGIDPKTVKLTVPRRIDDWSAAMTAVFRELHRVLRPGGRIAFEVGEVHAGTTRLDEAVVPCGMAAGLEPELILINDQKFTKTANCWGVDNMDKGTNTNRIVVLVK